MILATILLVYIPTVILNIFYNPLSCLVTIKSGWRYDNEIFSTSITLFFVFWNCRIATLTYSCSDIQWLRYNDGRRKYIYEN